MAKAPDRTPWDGIIVTDPGVCFGKVRIAGTRLYIDVLLSLIEHGSSFDELLEVYPGVTREQLAAMMGFVRDLVAAKRNRLNGDPALSELAPTLSPPLPPWHVHPDIPFGSIGWRMGAGEDGYGSFYGWYAALTDSEATGFAAAHPEPEGWQGWYARVRTNDWD